MTLIVHIILFSKKDNLSFNSFCWKRERTSVYGQTHLELFALLTPWDTDACLYRTREVAGHDISQQFLFYALLVFFWLSFWKNLLSFDYKMFFLFCEYIPPVWFSNSGCLKRFCVRQKIILTELIIFY